jgi:hypothetical protein
MKKLPAESTPTPYYDTNIHYTDNSRKRKLPQFGKLSLGTLNGPEEEETLTTTKRLRYPEIGNINEDQHQISSILGEFILSELTALNNDTKFWEKILDIDMQHQDMTRELEQFILSDSTADIDVFLK